MYLSRRFYIASVILILLIAGGYFYGPLFDIGRWMLAAFIVLVLTEAVLLYARDGLTAERTCARRFSNGDDNEVKIRVESSYPMFVRLTVIDEIPAVFQRRDVCFRLNLSPGKGKTIRYRLNPVKRVCMDLVGFVYLRLHVSV